MGNECYNNYSEEFKRKTVAAVRSGYSINFLAKKFNIPKNTVRYWICNANYADVQALDKEEPLPCLVPVSPSPVAKATSKESPVLKECLNAVFKTPNGVTLEFPQGLSMEQLKNLLLTFKEL